MAALCQVINMQFEHNSACFVEMSTWHVAYDTYSGFADTVTANIWSWRSADFHPQYICQAFKVTHLLQKLDFSPRAASASHTHSTLCCFNDWLFSVCMPACPSEEKKSPSCFCSSPEDRMKALKIPFFFFFAVTHAASERKVRLLSDTVWFRCGWEQVWGDDLIISRKVQSGFCSEIAQRKWPPCQYLYLWHDSVKMEVFLDEHKAYWLLLKD